MLQSRPDDVSICHTILQANVLAWSTLRDEIRGSWPGTACARSIHLFLPVGACVTLTVDEIEKSSFNKGYLSNY